MLPAMTKHDGIKLREQRRARVRRIRARVIGGSVALFLAVWILITVVLVSGHDPALARNAVTQSATPAAAATTSSSSGTGSSGTGTSADATSSTSSGATSSSTGSGSGGVGAVTSSQS